MKSIKIAYLYLELFRYFKINPPNIGVSLNNALNIINVCINARVTKSFSIDQIFEHN